MNTVIETHGEVYTNMDKNHNRNGLKSDRSVQNHKCVIFTKKSANL